MSLVHNSIYKVSHLLLQHGVLKPNKPHGLPLTLTTLPEKNVINVTLLPQQLKGLGYATHIVGK